MTCYQVLEGKTAFIFSLHFFLSLHAAALPFDWTFLAYLSPISH